MIAPIRTAILGAIRSGQVVPPNGWSSGELESFFLSLSTEAENESQWLHWIIRREHDIQVVQTVREIEARYHDAVMEEIQTAQAQSSRVESLVQSLDRVIRPLFDTRDAPPLQRWEWRNLWAFWQFVPGTIRPRVLLTLWTFKDWWIIGAVMFLLGSWAPWRALTALGALLALSVAGFAAHELWMRWWGIRVCKLEEVDPHEYALKFTPTFERFVSRYMH